METEAIARILGGRKVLGKAVRKPDDLAHLVRKGLPAGSVTALSEKLHLGSTVLARKLGIPLRTLTLSVLTPAESDRTVRMARVYANAIDMIGDEGKAIDWLNTPNRALGGERPIRSTRHRYGRAWSKTFSVASPMACIVDAIPANWAPSICCRSHWRSWQWKPS